MVPPAGMVAIAFTSVVGALMEVPVLEADPLGETYNVVWAWVMPTMVRHNIVSKCFFIREFFYLNLHDLTRHQSGLHGIIYAIVPDLIWTNT
jgi:hypothetical protein